MVKYDNCCIERSLCAKSTKLGTYDCYYIYSIDLLSIQDDRKKIQDGRLDINFFDISTLDGGDFNRIIEIHMSFLFFVVFVFDD